MLLLAAVLLQPQGVMVGALTKQLGSASWTTLFLARPSSLMPYSVLTFRTDAVSHRPEALMTTAVSMLTAGVVLFH
jgi:hypothetical protein